MTTATTTPPTPQPSSWQYSFEEDGTSLATYNGDVDVGGNIVYKNVTITGNLTVEGNTTLNETTINGPTTIEGNITINGNETIIGNLTVDGNTTIDGNLTVINETITGNLTVDGNITVQGGPVGSIVVLSPAVTTITTTGAAQGPYVAVGDALRPGSVVDPGSITSDGTGMTGTGVINLTANLTTAADNEVAILVVTAGCESNVDAPAVPAIDISNTGGLIFELRSSVFAQFGSSERDLVSVQVYWVHVPVAVTGLAIDVTVTFNANQSAVETIMGLSAWTNTAPDTPWDVNVFAPFYDTAPGMVSHPTGVSGYTFNVASSPSAVVIYASCGQQNPVPPMTGEGFTTVLTVDGEVGEAGANLSMNYAEAGAGLAGSGYAITGGWYHMWGQIASTADGDSTDVDFPIAFPNQCSAFSPSTKGTAVVSDNAAFQEVAASLTNTGVTVFLQNFGGTAGPDQDGSWMADGF